jgi:Trk-type K+ transport system membrane component
MQKDVQMGWAGSATVLILCIAVAILLRSFYKRYMRMSARNNENQSDN